MKEKSEFVKKHIIQQPEDILFTDVQIKGLLGKRVIADTIGPFQQRIKNRIMLYKRDRMIEAVRRKICSFFDDPQCSNVTFLYSGSENHATINSAFIETGDAGHEFEVTAGTSLLVHPKLEDPRLEDPRIITTEYNLNILTKNKENEITKEKIRDKLFKEGRIRKFMSQKHPPKPKLNNNNRNTKKRRIFGK
jgi:hypothetical protein